MTTLPATRLATIRTPAFWLFLSLLAISAVNLVTIFAPAVRHYPVAFATAVALFAAHGAVFIALLKAIDYLEPEPRWVLAAALIWGAIIATSNAIIANGAVFSILTKLFSLGFVEDWAAAISGPTTEELLKGLGVIMVVLLARRHINSALDGVVYGAFVGLGFQEVENVIYGINSTVQANDGDVTSQVFAIFLLRGFLAGLWSHTAYTALTGAGVAYAVLARNRSWPVRIGVSFAGFAAAWFAHFFWNSPLIINAAIKYFGVAGAIGGMLIKGVPVLVLFLVVVRFAGRREFKGYGGALRGVADPAIATEEEITALRSPVGRLRARWNAFVRGGLGTRDPVRHLQRNQANLALALVGPAGTAVTFPDHPEHANAATAQIHKARQDLARAGVYSADGERRRTAGGWISIVFGVLSVAIPILAVVPVAWFFVGVYRARSSGQHADMKLLAGLMLGLTFGALSLAGYLLSYVLNAQ